MTTDELWRMSATQVVNALRKGDLHPTEAVEAAIERIEAVDNTINALPVRCFERALATARNIRPSEDPRNLAGLPIAVKDYNDIGGVRTTYGSPIYADYTPGRSDATVAVLESRGANPLAKSNVPEWAGGHTFNLVNGLTRNPWNTERSAGGSSGGSGAALASGQVWLATGNDLGGSLRTPAGGRPRGPSRMLLGGAKAPNNYCGDKFIRFIVLSVATPYWKEMVVSPLAATVVFS